MLKHDFTVSRKSSRVWAAVCRRAENREGTGKQLRVWQRTRAPQTALSTDRHSRPSTSADGFWEELPWRKGGVWARAGAGAGAGAGGSEPSQISAMVPHPSLFYTS